MTVKAAKPVVLRGRSGQLSTVVLGVLMVWMLVDAAARGAWDLVLHASGWFLSALVLCWALLIRPRVEVRADGLCIVNLIRTHLVPWADIADLRMRYQLVIERTGGRAIRAWGSPSVERRRTDHDSGITNSARKQRFVDVVTVIEQAHAEVGTTPASAWTRVVWWPFALAAAFACIGALVALTVN